MTTMLSTRNALFRFSKSLPNVPSLSLPKPSRVFFASASNHSDWRNAAEGPKSTSGGWAYDSPSSKTVRDSNKIADRARATASEGVDAEDVKQFARDTQKAAQSGGEKAVDYAYEAKDNTQKAAESAGEKVKDYAYNTKEAAESAGGKVIDYAYEAKDAAQSAGERTAETTAKKTEEVVGATSEAVKNAGEKVKETAQGAWETAKDASQKIKETVVGKDDA